MKKTILILLITYILFLIFAVRVDSDIETIEEKEDFGKVTIIHEVTTEVTAYSEFDSCHYENCAMASGKRAYIGAVACPRHIELATRVMIDGKTYTCEDRTAKRYDGRYDIFMGYGRESYDKAINYGIKTTNVYIIN